MENDKLIVGLDIGTTKICAIIGRKNEFGKLEVLGMGKAVSDGVERGIVTNIDKTVTAIGKAVEECANMAEVDIAEVIVGIAGQHIQSKIMHGSIMRQPTEDEITVEDVQRLTADMHNIVVPPGNSIIHVMPQDYTVDYEGGIKDPVGMSGNRLEADFHIITAQTTAINNINKCVKRAQLSSKQLILEPLASSLSVLSEEEKEAGVCLIDIGGGTTDIAIFYENILKNRAPKEISIRNLASIIQARMEEIIEIVQNEIMQSGYYKKLAGGIVLTGGGSQMQFISQLFEYMTGLDTRIGFPNEHLGKSVLEDVKSPMYATTVGLVLAGFKSLDMREEIYQNRRANSGVKPKQVVTRDKISKDFFKNIGERLKGIISDDIGDDTAYGN